MSGRRIISLNKVMIFFGFLDFWRCCCCCPRRLLNCFIDNFSDLSMANLMSRFFLMTAQIREFPVIHKIIDIDVTADVTTSSNLNMAASI